MLHFAFWSDMLGTWYPAAAPRRPYNGCRRQLRLSPHGCSSTPKYANIAKAVSWRLPKSLNSSHDLIGRDFWRFGNLRQLQKHEEAKLLSSRDCKRIQITTLTILLTKIRGLGFHAHDTDSNQTKANLQDWKLFWDSIRKLQDWKIGDVALNALLGVLPE